MVQHTLEEYTKILNDVFRFFDFKNNEQKRAIECIVSEKYKDVIISMASNAGKSLCYLMPRFFRNSGVVLVISSHIALITNEIAYLTDLEIKATSITSLTPYEERDSIIQELSDIENNEFKFFYVTPEMIVKGSLEVKKFLNDLIAKQVCMIAVDQAHLLLDFSFRESYQELRKLRMRFPTIPWIALTTASQGMIQNISNSLSMNNPLIIRGSSVRKDIFYDVKFYQQNSLNIKDMIADLIESEVKQEENVTQKAYASGIIYCQTFDEADDIADQLCDSGVPCESYHKFKGDCDLILKKWKDGTFPILVATEEAFSLGINRSPLKFVVHMSYPKSIRTFYQRSGRIDVDGGCSRIIYTLNGGYKNFAVLNYMRTCMCRHQFIAMQISAENIKPCSNKCDNCLSKNVKRSLSTSVFENIMESKDFIEVINKRVRSNDFVSA